jgi:serine/threonine-protein kinase
MAPEQLRGEAVDRRADLYSVGAVLYEMLTGRRVVQNDYASAIPVVLGGQFPPPREITNEVSEELESIVLRALRTTPGDRFPSAAAMRQELERHAMQRGFLLSTTDLSDFVRTVMGVGTTRLGGATLRAAESARPNDLSFAPTELAVDMTPPKNDTGAAFDALLGMQLSPVETSAPFSVYRTAESPEVSVPAAPASSPRWSSESADDGVVPALRSDPVDADPLRLPAPSRAPLYFALALALVAVVGMMGLSWMAGDADTQTNAITETAVEPEPAASGTAAGATAETEARPTAETEVTVTDSGTPTSATTETDPEETQTAATAETSPAPRPLMRPSPPASVGTATLDINTNPWSTVFLDGRPIGSTPIQGHEVPAGRHVLRFENPALGVPETLVVDLEPGARRRVVQDLR